TAGHAEGGDRAVQEPGEGRYGEHADDDGGEGDAELGAGELEGQLLEGGDDAAGAPVAGRSGPFGVGALDGDEAELGGHEEAVGENEQECGCQEQQGGGHGATASVGTRTGRGRPALCREGAAQVLPDDPSIAGEGHSSGRRNPLAHRAGGRGAGAVVAPASTRLIGTRATAAG